MNISKGRVIVALTFFAAFWCEGAVSRGLPDLDSEPRFFTKLLRAVVRWQNLDPMKLPDQDTKMFPPAKAHIYDGFLSGLSTVFQTGPVVFSAGYEGVTATVNLGLGRTEAEYKIRLSTLRHHPILLKAFVPSSNIWLELKENTEAKLKLAGFNIRFPDGIRVYLRAVKPKDKFLDSILKTLTAILKPQMANIANKLLRGEVESALKKLNRFIETGKFELYSRRRRYL